MFELGDSMRRLFLASLALLAALAAAPFASAQTTLRVVMHADLKVFDPIWSGAYIVRNHGYMVYDTPMTRTTSSPQMVDSWTTSDTAWLGRCATGVPRRRTGTSGTSSPRLALGGARLDGAGSFRRCS